jgi:hypothetical protein
MAKEFVKQRNFPIVGKPCNRKLSLNSRISPFPQVRFDPHVRQHSAKDELADLAKFVGAATR